jgi:hypothetical protein
MRSRIRQRVANRLTVNFIKQLRKPGKYADGNGLWLVIEAPERCYWHYRYQWQGNQKTISFGSAELNDARTLHAQARALVARGVDPLAQRRAGAPICVPSPAFDPAAPSFALAADEYLAAHAKGWKNAKHRQQWQNTLTALYPTIGDVPIAQLDTSHVLQVLQPIWYEKPESASRLRGRIEAVIDYACVRGWRERDKLLSDMTLTAVLRRMGRADLTVHGFRSTFRDWAADNGKPADAAERALAHVLGGTRGAYERTDLFELRRTLLAEWACYLEQPAAEAVQLSHNASRSRVDGTTAPRPSGRTSKSRRASGAA